MKEKAIELLTKINNAGYTSYIVGGYPRDLYLKRITNDIDICTNATPKDLKEIFGDAMLPKVNYGSVTVIYKKVRFEITTFRKEYKYVQNRVPGKIKYIDNLLDDLKRRDFTINTICINQEGNVIDLLDGIKDINDRKIKMVGNPKDKLREDALRILRAIRFATQLNFELDENLYKNIKKYGYLVKNLSYYRKKEELNKIFLSDNREYGIRLIKELGLDTYLELDMSNLVITEYPIGIWAQMNVLDKYDFNSNDYDTIKKINEIIDKPITNRILYEYGLYIVSIVANIKGISKRNITMQYNKLPIKSKHDIITTPSNIMNILSKGAGSYIKDILNDLESKILDGILENDYFILKDYILANYSNI